MAVKARMEEKKLASTTKGVPQAKADYNFYARNMKDPSVRENFIRDLDL